MNNMLYTADLSGSIQRGEKTQTRRIDKRLPSGDVEVTTQFDEQGRCFVFFDGKCFPLKYRLGEVLWVREPAKVVEQVLDGWFGAEYLSDGTFSTFKIPDRFYPLPKWLLKGNGIPNGCIREMARTFIRITNIRVERLNEISEEDAEHEGILRIEEDDGIWYPDYTKLGRLYKYAKSSFQTLWESINGKNSFNNRWVPVYEFALISKEEAIS